jgi:hypothetical protein
MNEPDMTALPARQAHAHPGPARLLPLDEREHQQEQGRAERRDARPVELPGGDGARRRHVSRGQQEHGDPDRHVHPEHRPPAGAEQVRADEQPADDLPADGGHAHHDAEHAVDAVPSRRRHQHRDRREDLGNHHCGAQSLDDARGDQAAGARRQRTGD